MTSDGGEDLDRLSYEQLLEQLESLTERMASGDIGIEEATELYERASALHAVAIERLERIEARIAALAPRPADPA